MTGLFIFLPLVPIAFFGWLVFKSEEVLKDDVPRAMRDVHAEYLSGLVKAMPESMEDPQSMLEYFVGVLPADAAVRVVDTKGGVLAQGGGEFSRGQATISQALPNSFLKWRVQVAALPGTWGREHPQGRR